MARYLSKAQLFEDLQLDSLNPDTEDHAEVRTTHRISVITVLINFMFH